MALELKKGLHRTVELDGLDYYPRSNPNGYGYEIMIKERIGEGEYDFKYDLYYRHTSRDAIKNLFDWIIENEKLPDDLSQWNDIPKEPILKIVVHRTKHHTYHYRAESIEELEKVLRSILKERVEEGYYYNPLEDSDAKNTSGFDSKEDIEKLPDGKVKEYALKEWESYETFSKRYAEDIRRWKELEKVLEGWGKLGNVERVIFHFEGDRLSIEDATIVK